MDHEINGLAVLLALPGLLLVLILIVGLPLLVIEQIIRLFVTGFRFGPFRHVLWHLDGEFYPYKRNGRGKE